MIKRNGIALVVALTLGFGCGRVDSVGVDAGEPVDGGDQPDAVAVDAQEFSCPADCTRLGDAEMCLCEENLDWDAARGACAADDLVLARVDDQASSDIVRGESDRLDFPIWLGGTDTAGEGEWRWEKGGDIFWLGLADGSPPAGMFADFSQLEPNNGGVGENCLEAVNGGWNDVPCGVTRPYVCGPL